MVNPEFDYCVVSSKKGNLVVSAERLTAFFEETLSLTGSEYEVLRTLKGSQLQGLSYEHPFAADTAKYSELKAAMPKVHTVLLSAEYVTTGAGTGLVHCAPGCGPEDYEVGSFWPICFKVQF
jgi:isoleucyl-tRNA synthetase